jgi:hypothetical protein
MFWAMIHPINNFCRFFTYNAHTHLIFACNTFSFNKTERWYCSNCPKTYCTLNNRSVRRNNLHIFYAVNYEDVCVQLTERKLRLNLCFLSDYVGVFTKLNRTGSKEGECETQLTRLKGRCHDIFCFCFISSNSFIIPVTEIVGCRRYWPTGNLSPVLQPPTCRSRDLPPICH